MKPELKRCPVCHIESPEGRFHTSGHLEAMDEERWGGPCSGDGLGEPSTCQIHMAPWYRSKQKCEAAG